MKSFKDNKDFSNQIEDDYFTNAFLILKITFEELGVDNKIIEILKNNGFEFLSDLLSLEKEDFLQFKGFNLDLFESLSLTLKEKNFKIPISFDQAANLSEQKTYYSFLDTKNNYLSKKIDIENYEKVFIEIANGSYDKELTFLLEIFEIIEKGDLIVNVFNQNNFEQEKRFLKFQFLKKVFEFESENVLNFLFKTRKTFLNSKTHQKSLYCILCKMSGMTLQKIGDTEGVTRERSLFKNGADR